MSTTDTTKQAKYQVLVEALLDDDQGITADAYHALHLIADEDDDLYKVLVDAQGRLTACEGRYFFKTSECTDDDCEECNEG